MTTFRFASTHVEANDSSARSSGSLCDSIDPELDSAESVRSSIPLHESDILKPCAKGSSKFALEVLNLLADLYR